MKHNYAFVPTPGTANHVPCCVRGGRGTTRRYVAIMRNNGITYLQTRFVPFFVQGMSFGILFGLSLVLLDEGFANFNAYTFLLALPFGAIVGVVVTLLVLPLLKVGGQEYSLETVFSIENIKQVSVELGIVALIVGAVYLLWKN